MNIVCNILKKLHAFEFKYRTGQSFLFFFVKEEWMRFCLYTFNTCPLLRYAYFKLGITYTCMYMYRIGNFIHIEHVQSDILYAREIVDGVLFVYNSFQVYTCSLGLSSGQMKCLVSLVS